MKNGVQLVLTFEDKGNVIKIMRDGEKIFSKEYPDTRGAEVDSITMDGRKIFFVCNEYDSYCSLSMYFLDIETQLVREINLIDITESVLLIENPELYSLNFENESLFQIDSVDLNVIRLRTNLFEDSIVKNLSVVQFINLDSIGRME